jgi:hypothetical protein
LLPLRRLTLSVEKPIPVKRRLTERSQLHRASGYGEGQRADNRWASGIHRRAQRGTGHIGGAAGQGPEPKRVTRLPRRRVTTYVQSILHPAAPVEEAASAARPNAEED